MNPRKIAAAALGLALAGAAGLSFAEGMQPAEAPMPSVTQQPAPLPPYIQQDAHGTRYLSGGVSLEERDYMHDLAGGQFPLRIVSAVPAGNLVADVDVAITDAKGREVLSVSDAGPVVYVALPPGKYRVTANNGGQIESRDVAVGRGHREVGVFWRGEQPS